MRLVQVAVPVPQLDRLTYSIPDDFPDPHPGARVLVPLGKRTMTGVVVSQSVIRDPGSGIRSGAPSAKSDADSRAPVTHPGSRTTDPGTIKPIIDILDALPFLPADVVKLAEWVAEYYACGIGEAIAAAMPPRAWIESERHAHITVGGRDRLAHERGSRRLLLEALQSGHPVRLDSLVRKAGSHAILLGLEREGLVEITQPLMGQASAYRTVRVASLTVQGHEIASSETSRGVRQREALSLLKAAPDGLDTSELARRGINAGTIASNPTIVNPT